MATTKTKRQPAGWYLYQVHDTDGGLLYIGTVTDAGVICPSRNAPDPRKEPWWQAEAAYVAFGGKLMTRQEFDRLQS